MLSFALVLLVSFPIVPGAPERVDSYVLDSGMTLEDCHAARMALADPLSAYCELEAK